MPPAPKNRDARKDAAPRQSRIGNAATASLLGESAGGKTLPPAVVAKMEHSLGVDLSHVRVRDDAAAHNATQSLEAEAFLQDGQIYWGSGAPPVESAAAEPLLAHELAHAAQLEEASSIQDRVSAPGETSEVQANQAASQALAGQQASAGKGGAVAGTQTQPKVTIVEAEYAEVALTAFLQKVASTVPPQDIRTAQVVKDALTKLLFSGGPSLAVPDVAAFMASAPNAPAKMAHEFVKKVRRISKSAVDSLATAPFIDRQPSKIERVGQLIKSTTPADMPKPIDPTQKSSEDQAKETQEKFDAIRQTKSPPVYGPVSIDLLRLWNIKQNYQKVVNAPPTKAPSAEAQSYPEVEAAIAKIPKNIMVPKGKADDGSWADAQDFARDLARQLDIAQKANQDTITMPLGDNYSGIQDRDAMRDAVESIIAQIRKALPHHAAAVKHVDVRTGKSLLTRGMIVETNP
jgi:hypothetical protein